MRKTGYDAGENVLDVRHGDTSIGRSTKYRERDKSWALCPNFRCMNLYKL